MYNVELFILEAKLYHYDIFVNYAYNVNKLVSCYTVHFSTHAITAIIGRFRAGWFDSASGFVIVKHGGSVGFSFLK